MSSNNEALPSDARLHLPQGALYLSLGQGAFLLSGYLLHAFLARWLTPAMYGVFGVVMVILGWAEIAVNNGVPVAQQKLLPDGSLSEWSVRRAAAQAQWLVSIGVFLALFLAAPWLAALLKDLTLAFYLRVAFVDILAMGAYAYYRGLLNGWRAFRQLAVTIAFYALTKLIAIGLLVVVGLGVQGALIGNVVSSLGGLCAGYLWSRRHDARPGLDPPRPNEPGKILDARQVLAFALPAALFTLASNLLLGLDLMGVKALAADADQVGYYSAAVNLANAPRLVLLAFSFALLPSLSHAIAAQDLAQTRRYLQQTVRLLALVLLPILALVTATAGPLVTFVFSAAYLPAAPILAVLIFTYAAYTVYITLVTALLAENRPGRALLIPLALLPLAATLIWLGVSRFGVRGAAFASLASVAGAASIVIGYVVRRFRPAVNALSLLRIAVAALLVWGIARLWLPSGLVLIPAYGLLGGLYLLLLFGLGEIKRQDVALAKTWLAYPLENLRVRRGTRE